MNNVIPVPKWATIEIGNGRLEYRSYGRGLCLCRAIGKEALNAGRNLLGPPTLVTAQDRAEWRLLARGTASPAAV